MKGFAAVLMVVSLISMPLAAVGAAGMRAAVGSLEFIPLIAVAPDAQLVLVEANPAETQGVQGFPSMFQGEAMAIQAYPGSVISQSFAVTEQSFNGATATQIARFDDVYAMAAANRVTIVSAAGDSGTANVDKQGRLYPFPTAEWPASDPLVTAAGGT